MRQPPAPLPRIVQCPAAPDGSRVTLVEISNRRGAFARFDADDWDELFAERRPSLMLHGAKNTFYVRTACPGVVGGVDTVARLLTGAGRGEVVKHADGDRLNLRRANLRLCRDTRAGLPRAAPPPSTRPGARCSRPAPFHDPQAAQPAA